MHFEVGMVVMSLADWMTDKDLEWQTRLKPANLVVETNFFADEVRDAQSKYGLFARQLLDRGWTHKKVVKRYPALTLMILVGHAALAYDHGAYWESFWDELGMSRDADFENELRRSVAELLDKFSLARFPDIEQESARKYVMTLALHAGIPVHCLGDLLVVISDHITQGRPATGAAVMEWLEEPGKEYRAAALDVPVRNFLVNGAEFAADILDRIIEFVEATTADPTLLNAELNAATTGLPSALLDELVIRLRETPLHFDRKRLTSSGAQHPTIAYDVNDDEIVLVLPAPSVDSEKPWRVSFDGEVREVHNTRKWGGDAQTAAARVAVPAPVREAVISHAGGSAGSAVPLVLKSDPLLTFDKNGRWIPRRDGLKDCVWAVLPSDYQLVDARTKNPVECRDVGCPAGWHGWRSAFLELDDVSALQLCRDGLPVGTKRLVRKDARPSFELGSIVAGVLTADGRSVHSARPWVVLPPSLADPGPDWIVRIRRVGDTEWIAEESWVGEDVQTCVDPFDDAAGPQLGLFEIVVTGPLGADARCVVFVAEGIETKFDTLIRVPVAGGLTRCVGQTVADGVSISPAGPVEFGPRDLEVRVQVQTQDASAALVLQPPHVEIRTGEVGTPAAWRMTADVCDPEDFTQDRFVAVRVPGVETVEFGYFSAMNDLLQVDPSPRRRTGDVFESRIQQFADTVRHHPTGRIVATLRTDSGHIEVTVLSAQPRRLASEAHLRDCTLVFNGIAALEDLAVYVWSSTAPWRSAEVLPVVDGVTLLPDHLVDAGELRCQLFIDDPWVSIDPPPMPGDAAFRVEQLGWREDGTSAQVKLSRYLVGRRSAPVEVGAIPEVWAALAKLHADGKAERFAGLITLLADDFRKALECLGNSTIPAGEKMAMLMRSELVNHSYTAEQTLNKLHFHPWFGCMVELADLPSLYQRRQEVRAERAETLAYMRDRGGERLIELLKTGKTACIKDASFDANVLAMSFVPGNQVEAKLREIQLVPRAQLHPDTLRAAVYEAFCRRTDWLTSGWSPNFAQQTSLVISPIKRVSKLAHRSILMRSDRVQDIDASEHPWMLMSVQSLTLAFLARLEAHRRIGGQYLNSGLLSDWARLAQLCPTMVANDLLIAEALVLYDCHGDLIGGGR
ncbi:hypothetical protein [Mycobacterium marinum]|uniref:hypothetical protein n=1 Tax=Mycobacterium marinum TaxID=1781 RepID=UPI001FB81EAB|nr:hypothetical protein [Mycobacterium marinum]